jgi:hypothetical protein
VLQALVRVFADAGAGAGACSVAWEEWLRKERVKNAAADRSEAVQACGGKLGGAH